MSVRIELRPLRPSVILSDISSPGLIVAAGTSRGSGSVFTTGVIGTGVASDSVATAIGVLESSSSPPNTSFAAAVNSGRGLCSPFFAGGRGGELARRVLGCTTLGPCLPNRRARRDLPTISRNSFFASHGRERSAVVRAARNHTRGRPGRDGYGAQDDFGASKKARVLGSQ